jgi:hypothetical protein
VEEIGGLPDQGVDLWETVFTKGNRKGGTMAKLATAKN